MNIKDRLPYIIIGMVVLIGIVYGLFVCTKIDRNVLSDSDKENISEEQEIEILSKIVETNYTGCFQKETYYPDSRRVSCELSGVCYYRNQLYFVSDRKIPGHSSLFAVNYKLPLLARYGKYMGNSTVRSARGIEDISVAPNLKHLFFITSFEENRPDNDRQFLMNNLFFYMNTENTDSAFIVPDKAKTKGEIYSLRENIQTAMRSKLFPYGPPYFKIEGLAVITDSTVLLGISRIGESQKKSRPVGVILRAKYHIDANNRFLFDSDFEEFYRMHFEDFPFVESGLFLTSMEYDFYSEALYITTAYHNGYKSGDVGGYLWRIGIKELELHLPPELIKQTKTTPLHFAHKPAGVAVIDHNTVFVICDDDRMNGEQIIVDPRKNFYRELNQAAYYVIRL